MRGWLVFVFLLCVGVLAESSVDVFSASSMTINTSVTGKLDVESQSSSSIKYLSADVFVFPRSDVFQRVIGQSFFPMADVDDRRVRFLWETVPDEAVFKVESLVQRNDESVKITRKIAFPLASVPDDVKKYLSPSPKIDSSSPEIAALASQLSNGESDLFVLVTKFADWTRQNIEYNLSTLTAEAVQPASWVLREKYGVCDEMTSLFVALLRAIGVPARFVAGISFSTTGWGPHGWAEVFFPDFGWVPFDPTFGQYGWVDVSHVKLNEVVDPSMPSSSFEWLGHDVVVRAGKLNVSSSLIRREAGGSGSGVVVDVVPLHREVGFGSFSAVEAKVKNARDFYQAVELSLANVAELVVDGSRLVVLGPREEKVVHWVVQVRSGLNKNFLYIIPLVVYSERNESWSNNFSARQDGAVFSKEEVYITPKVVNDTVHCVSFPAKSVNGVECILSGNGLASLCLQDSCQDVFLDGERSIVLPVNGLPAGVHHETVIVHGAVNASVLVPVVVEDTPQLTIKEIRVPKEVGVEEWFVARIVLSKNSFSIPKNVSVTVGGVVVDVGDVFGEEVVETRMQGRMFGAGRQSLDVFVKYGESYTAAESVEIRVVPRTWKEWFVAYAVRLARIFMISK